MSASRIVFVLCAACLAAITWVAGPAGRLVVVSGLLLFAPGFLLFRIMPDGTGQTLWSRPAQWLGLSISMIALLYQWATALGFALTLPVLTALAWACAGGVVVVLARQTSGSKTILLPLLLAAFVLVVTLALRLYQIRDLALPAWVDSVHHALMIRVAIERGQAPLNLSPYLDVEQLPYHWGYHVVAAASAQLAQASVPQVMLWQGQVLNALHVLTCAALAAHVWRKPWAGVIAAVVVGVVSLMPAFYASWGRYTQLTGLLLLPALAISWHDMLRDRRARELIFCMVLLAGLNLVHVRVLIFALCLLAAQTIVWSLDRSRRETLHGLGIGVVAGVAAMLATAPWLWLLVQRQLGVVVTQPGAFFSAETYGGLDLGLLWSGQNRLLVALALAGALWGLWQRKQAAPLVMLWLAGMVALANPRLILFVLPVIGLLLLIQACVRRTMLLAVVAIGLMLSNPLLLHFASSWLITNDVVAISLFLPLGVLIGGIAVGWEKRRALELVMSMLVVGATLLGAWQTRDVIRPSTVLATQADVAAIAWVEANTPPDARFLIGAAPWFGSASRGVDGGWWLLPLAGRQTSTPPVLFVYEPLDKVLATVAFSQLVINYSAERQQELYARMARDRISYIYLTERSGSITAAFNDSQRFVPVYQHDGVTILAVQSES